MTITGLGLRRAGLFEDSEAAFAQALREDPANIQACYALTRHHLGRLAEGTAPAHILAAAQDAARLRCRRGKGLATGQAAQLAGASPGLTHCLAKPSRPTYGIRKRCNCGPTGAFKAAASDATTWMRCTC